ncbi:MAG: hypothetical protein O3A51_08415 [Verrucomicrobia bacterium]|nr:hypothetical protein [Verrucomicrobiota bacterium]
MIDDLNFDGPTDPLKPLNMWQAVDAVVDDGNLGTGLFQALSARQIIYSLEERDL